MPSHRGSPRLAIIGAGPVGLEAGLCAKKLGLRFTIVEKGQVGENLRSWGHVKLFSPFSMNTTPLGLSALKAEHPRLQLPSASECLTGHEYLETYLDPIAQSPLADSVMLETEVISIGRRGFLKHEPPGKSARAQQPFLILLRNAEGEKLVEADCVFDCTGTYGKARWLGEGGIPALGESESRGYITYTLEDILGEKKQAFADRNVLVYGAGYSAATSVCALAKLAEQHPETWIIWASRGKRSQPISRFVNDPLKERDLLAGRANRLATRNEGNVEFHPQTIVTSIRYLGKDGGFAVETRSAGRDVLWEVDRVIANVGYTPDTSLYRELHIEESYTTEGPVALAQQLQGQSADCLATSASSVGMLTQPEPGFFILGSKSFGRNSHFLMRTGFEQVREALALIAKKPRLADDQLW